MADFIVLLKSGGPHECVFPAIGDIDELRLGLGAVIQCDECYRKHILRGEYPDWEWEPLTGPGRA